MREFTLLEKALIAALICVIVFAAIQEVVRNKSRWANCYCYIAAMENGE